MIKNIIYSITGLFFLILLIKSISKKEKICSICLSVTFTWIILFILYHLGIFNDVIILSFLMGMTFLGVFYTIERKVHKNLTFFRLPFLLTLILLAYFIITLDNLFQESIFILTLWILFIITYSYRRNKRFEGFVNKIIECCKKW